MSMTLEAPEASPGSRCEFKTYHSFPKKDGRMTTETLVEPFAEVRAGDGDGAYALVVQRTFTDRRELDSTVLTVNSPHIRRAFGDVVGDTYTTVPSDFSAPLDLTSPFQMLMHYWDELEQHRDATADDAVRQHLGLLLDFMRHEMGPDRDTLRAMLRRRQITYRWAWALFRPGDLMYTTVMGHPWLLRCHSSAYETSTSSGPYLKVNCVYTDHDGSRIGEATDTIAIYQKRTFGAENPAAIQDLPIYPRRFAEGGSGIGGGDEEKDDDDDGEDSLESRLEARGKKFLARLGVSVEAYDGHAQFLKEPPFSFFDPDMATFGGVWLPFTETGRIVLDRKTFSEDQYSAQPEIRRAAAGEHDPLTCPPYAIGYSLSRKEWCRFFVDNLRDVVWKPDVWDSLVLPAEQKLVLQALVTCHDFPDSARDQPEQKGKGLVVLLHGTPGSGKTLTAETAAEGSQKALVSTSLSELNRDRLPWVFEHNLKQVLQYATRWRAVVLLDEADVFLEARSPTADGGSSSHRNSLVAIFLKELEYFSGIVFLTTNRLDALDPAMRSRIHLAMGYDPPDLDMRRQIWTRCLSLVPAAEADLVASGGDGDTLDDVVDSLVAEKLNGREIANAVNTARTISRFRREPLRLAHIESVLSVRHDFDRSLKKEARRLTAGGRGPLLKRDSIVTAEPEYKS